MKPKGILLDLDGTLLHNGEKIIGAIKTLNYIKRSNIPFKILTNTTKLSKKNIISIINDTGINIKDADICTVPEACALYCKNKNYKNINLIVQNKDLKKDFTGFSFVNKNPDAIPTDSFT